jgi:hypothetical protein
MKVKKGVKIKLITPTIAKRLRPIFIKMFTTKRSVSVVTR